MTFVEAMGILIGAALLLLGLCALVIRLEKKFPSKRYDERQKEAQGRAYKWTSVVGFLYFTTMLFLDFLFPSGLPMDLSFVIFIGMALQALVYALYCSLQGAYFPLRKSPKINIILLYIAGALNLINGANNVRWLGITLEKDYLEIIEFPDVRLSATGVDVAAWLLLIGAVMFLTLATVQLIRYMRDQRE